jgi:hypothetical protein
MALFRSGLRARELELLLIIAKAATVTGMRTTRESDDGVTLAGLEARLG